jgi:predicted DNA binding CopG/RHH family protein
MKAKDLDKIFDDGEVDITDYLDLSKSFRPGQEQKRVNVDFPTWMLERIDKEAGKLGVPRQSLIKVWVGERLERKRTRRKSGPTVS